jgi:hypothetical protein
MDIFNESFSFTVFALCLTWTVSMVFFAELNGMATEMQMYEKFNFLEGIPLLDHWGFLGAATLITLTLSVIVPTYSFFWTPEQLFFSFTASTIISVPMSYIWTKATKTMVTKNGEVKKGLPEAMAIEGHITMVGILLVVFMIPAMTCFFQFYFCSNVSKEADLVVSLVVAIHLIFSSHIPLHIRKPHMYPRNPLRDPLNNAVLLGMFCILIIRHITL